MQTEWEESGDIRLPAVIFFSIDRTESDYPINFQGYVHILNMRVTTADPIKSIKQSGGGMEG